MALTRYENNNEKIIRQFIFRLVKGWQQFGPVSKLEPLLAEPYVAVYGRSS